MYKDGLPETEGFLFYQLATQSSHPYPKPDAVDNIHLEAVLSRLKKCLIDWLKRQQLRGELVVLCQTSHLS